MGLKKNPTAAIAKGNHGRQCIGSRFWVDVVFPCVSYFLVVESGLDVGTVIGAQVQEDVESLKRLVRKQLDLDIQRYMILSWACGSYLG